MQRMMATDSNRKRIRLRTLVAFFGILAVLNGAHQLDQRYFGEAVGMRYTELATVASSYVASMILPFAVVQRDSLTIGTDHTAVVIRSGCNGIEAIFLMLAGILAFPATWNQRLKGIVTFLPALFVLNLFRIVALLYVFTEYPEHIDLAHYQVGQAVMVLVVMVFWLRHLRHGGEFMHTAS